jgi:glycosyltransferase involved in cell wall biosynthesis
VTSVAVLSRAVGPPWADGSINTHVAWARAMPDVEFRWFGSAGWRPTEANFRASGSGATDNSWGTSQKLRFVTWFAATRADLFHLAFYPQPGALRMLRPLLAIKRRPVVQTVQAAFSPLTPVEPLLVSRHLVAASARIARELVAVVPGLDVTVVYPAVERSLVETVACEDSRKPDDTEVLRSVGVEEGRRALLYAGNWSERLGVAEALEVFAGIAHDVDDVDLVVANRVSLRSTHAHAEARVRSVFEARVAELGIASRIHVVGLLPDFRRIIAASSALLFPALDLREGKLDLPLVVLEAIALGVPVGLYDIAPLDEFPFASAGAVVPPGDRTSLTAMLSELLTDRESHGRAAAAGRALALECFDPASRASLLRGVYERAVSTGASAR